MRIIASCSSITTPNNTNTVTPLQRKLNEFIQNSFFSSKPLVSPNSRKYKHSTLSFLLCFFSVFFLVPDIINLNISLQNVDFQSVLVKWDPLPKYYWNGPEPSYAVKFQDISRGLNITVEIPLGTTQLNCTQLEHFTSYSVSIMALNYLGSSLPTYGGIIKTLDFGK